MLECRCDERVIAQLIVEPAIIQSAQIEFSHVKNQLPLMFFHGGAWIFLAGGGVIVTTDDEIEVMTDVDRMQVAGGAGAAPPEALTVGQPAGVAIQRKVSGQRVRVFLLPRWDAGGWKGVATVSVLPKNGGERWYRCTQDATPEVYDLELTPNSISEHPVPIEGDVEVTLNRIKLQRERGLP